MKNKQKNETGDSNDWSVRALFVFSYLIETVSYLIEKTKRPKNQKIKRCKSSTKRFPKPGFLGTLFSTPVPRTHARHTSKPTPFFRLLCELSAGNCSQKKKTPAAGESVSLCHVFFSLFKLDARKPKKQSNK